MSAKDSAASHIEYEFEPFEYIFLRRRDQILQLVALTSFALRSLNGLADLSDALKRPPEAIQEARELEALALAEVKADLPLLHSSAAVLIWGALEAAFRDFLIRWFVRYPTWRSIPEFKSIRVQVAEYESLQGEDRMRFLVGVFERELAATFKPGAGRFECLLKPFGIAPQVSEDERRDLNELAAVRNVIVHRAGVADARLIKLCPWLGLKLGDFVVVDREAFQRYVQASSHYAAAIIRSAEVVSKATIDNKSAAQSSVTTAPPNTVGG